MPEPQLGLRKELNGHDDSWYDGCIDTVVHIIAYEIKKRTKQKITFQKILNR
jgi:hypothetical protein